jgi:hypothetical protein
MGRAPGVPVAALRAFCQPDGGGFLMRTENDVVRAVSGFLASRGFEIVQALTTDLKGIDVIARGEGAVWYVEAKGATSSKPDTNRYGRPFDTAQILSHVSRAIYTAMAVLGRAPGGPRTRVALALPDNEGHRVVVEPVRTALARLGIAAFWVRDDLGVSLEDPLT